MKEITELSRLGNNACSYSFHKAKVTQISSGGARSPESLKIALVLFYHGGSLGTLTLLSRKQ